MTRLYRNTGLLLMLLPGVSYLVFYIVNVIGGHRGELDGIISLIFISIIAFIITWRWSFSGSLITIGLVALTIIPILIFWITGDSFTFMYFCLLVLPLLVYTTGGLLVFFSEKRTQTQRRLLAVVCFVMLVISIIWIAIRVM